TTPPTTAAAANAAYRTYMALSILWSCRSDDAALAECTAAASDVTKLFDILDRREWEALKKAPLEIQFPANSDPSGLEAFDLLRFSITAGGGPVETSYLFHHRMLCTWSFTFTPKRRLFGSKMKSMTLGPKTIGPSVMQYFPLAGKVQAFATL